MININCTLDPSGLSTVGQSYFKLFFDHGFDLNPHWITQPNAYVVGQYLDDFAQKMLKWQNNDNNIIQLWCGRSDIFKRTHNTSCSIISLIVEGNRLTDGQIKGCQLADIVLVPTSFCYNACISSGVPKSKLFYCSYPIQNIWQKSFPRKPHKIFKFLYLNTWYERKGYDLLLRAWWNTFTKDDPVSLTIKTYKENDRNYSIAEEIDRIAIRFNINLEQTAPIYIIDNLLPLSQMPEYMSCFDALVSPHRSEGFGMNIWHAMFLGIPVICTNYGGNTDFTKSDNSWLIKVEKMTKPSEKELSIFQHLNGIVWSEPDINDIGKQMKDCFENPKETENRAEKGKKLVQNRYTSEVILKSFFNALPKKIHDKILVEKEVKKISSQYNSDQYQLVSMGLGSPLTLLEV